MTRPDHDSLGNTHRKISSPTRSQIIPGHWLWHAHHTDPMQTFSYWPLLQAYD